MGRRKKIEIERDFSTPIIGNPLLGFEVPKEFKSVKITPVPEKPAININKITIDQYLSNYSTRRNLDSTFIKWFRKIDSTNPYKTIEEWNELNNKFLNEVV
jgi:hypothetical protein